jgi:hypothetical protein
VFEVDSNTVLQWLVEAAGQLTTYTRYFLCDVHVTQWQLDELYAVLRNVKDGEISEDDASKRLERSPYCVWTVMDPESTLLLDIEMGTRTLARAQCVVHQVVQVLAPDCVPLCLTDGYQDYMMAFLSHCGYWLQPSRQRAYGPAPKAALDAAAAAAVCPGGEVVPSQTHCGCETPCGVRDNGTGHARVRLVWVLLKQ